MKRSNVFKVLLVIGWLMVGLLGFQVVAQLDDTYEDLQKWLFDNAQNVRLSAKWNVQGKIWEGSLWDSRHTGVDYAAPEGTPVYSATDGCVIRVEHGKDCNKLECLSTLAIYNEATNVTFFYLHMKDIRVKVNDEVKVGDWIGAVGMRGPATSFHLHFEARPGEKTHAAVDVRHTINPYEAAKKATEKTDSIVIGVLGISVLDKHEKIYFVQPLAEYKEGKFNSLFWHFDESRMDSEEKAKAQKIKQLLSNIQTYWLYDKGSIVGRFEANKIIPSMLYADCGGDHIAVESKVSWKKDYIPKMTETGAVGDCAYFVIENVIALNRLVTQPTLLLRKKDLSREQISSLDKILHSTIKRAPLLLKDKQWPGDTSLNKRDIEVMDINKDGKPEVYAEGYSKTVTKGQEFYPEVIACVFLTWKDNKWMVLKRTTGLLDGERILEGEFSIEAVADIDGDGIAELILNERTGYEANHIWLYRMQNEKLEKLLDIGGYGL